MAGELNLMITSKNSKLTRIATALVLGLCALPVQAYLDPGSGSLIIQGIIGAIAAVGVTLKLYWHKIKLKLGGRKPTDTEDDSGQNNGEEK